MFRTRIKKIDYIILILFGLYFLIMQFNLLWYGYLKSKISYKKYLSSINEYEVISGQVIETNKKMIAGIERVIHYDINSNTVYYKYNGSFYSVSTIVYPDFSKGDTIKIAVNTYNPQMFERAIPYSFSNFPAIAQIIVLILECIFILIVVKIIQFYKKPTQELLQNMYKQNGYIITETKTAMEKYNKIL